MVSNTIIKNGYKLTEIGLIPEDWDVLSIKNLAIITTGSKNTQDRIPDGIYPFFVRSQTIERINSYCFDGEAVLTAGDGVGTGKVFHYINGKFDIHQRVYKISDFDKRINGYFFYLYFSNNFYNRIMQMTAKSSVDSVRMEMIADMKVPVPTKIEQISITTILSDTDSLIEHLDKLIDKKKSIKQGTMQQLLTGKKRLPGFSNDWEVKSLGMFTEFTNGKPYENFVIPEGKFKLITLDSVDIRGDLKDEHRGVNFIDGSLRKNDLVMVLSDIAHAKLLGLCGLITLDNSYVLNQRMGRLRFLDIIEPKFIRYQINRHQDFFRMRGQGSSQKHIYKKDVYDLEIPVPCKEEQIAISNILSDLDVEICSLEQKRDKYIMLKNGMMQQLLTGNIRLHVNN